LAMGMVARAINSFNNGNLTHYSIVSYCSVYAS
jgi:hypothetical protein